LLEVKQHPILEHPGMDSDAGGEVNQASDGLPSSDENGV
jgi:hypothetical protein